MLKEASTFTCEVKVERNGLEVPMLKSKGKSKTIRLYIYTSNPETNGNQPSQASSSSDQESIIRICNNTNVQGQIDAVFSFNVSRIKKIFTGCLKEGKLTIVINEGEENPFMNSRNMRSDLSLKESLSTEMSTNIFFSKGTVQMLE